MILLKAPALTLTAWLIAVVFNAGALLTGSALFTGSALAATQTATTPGFTAASFQKPDAEKLRQKLTPMQYRVTQEDATEPAYDNAYWDEKRPGIYVDVVSGEPLFASIHKYDSETGWPSFYRPLVKDNLTFQSDFSFFGRHVEVRSKHADSHLGHVFEDGPEPTGLRYCINSAALRFIPAQELQAAGYGEFAALFEE